MMSDLACLLDDLVLTPTALSPASPASSHATQTAVRIGCPKGPGLKLRFPFFVKGLTPPTMSAKWQSSCGLLAKNGIPIFATVADLSSVSATETPARIAVRSLLQPFSKEELSTADAIVLNNQDTSGHWAWPFEIDNPRELSKLVYVLREATEGQLPIGMALPMGTKQADLKACVEAKVDFLSLATSSENLTMSSANIASFTALSLMGVRRFCEENGASNLPILADVPVTSTEHMIKLIALGASALNLAAMIQRTTATMEPKVSESRLAENLLGVRPAAVRSAKEIPEAERELGRLIERLQSVLHFSGALDVSHLDVSYLRSLSRSTAETLGIPLASAR